VKKPYLSAFVLFGVAAIGCTSLLGDFEVQKATAGDGGTCTPGTPGCGADGCPTGQAKCGDTCVDTQTNHENCGACGRACPANLSCGGGNCNCPDQGAFCDGMCFPKTDKAHCGPTCIACPGNQVCTGQCVDPPPPAFEKLPLPATGWTNAAGEGLSLTVKDTGQPNTTYECRTFPQVAATPPAFKACDGAAGTGRVHKPVEDATTPEGTYVTEYRYKLGTFTSPTVSARYYVIKKLNGVASCPRQGVPLDGPHFTEDKYFSVAKTFSTAAGAAFPTTNTFPAGGGGRNDAIYLGNPWIKIPFQRIARTHGMASSSSFDDDQWPAANGDYLFNERSLRHRWSISPDRTMILITRMFIHPTTNDCKQRFTIGDEMETFFGPPGRGKRKLDCEAVVLNTQGNMICLNPDPAKPEPIVTPVDVRLKDTDGAEIATNATTYVGANYLYSPTAAWKPAYAGGYVQVPEAPYGRWYKVQGFPPGSANYLYLTETLQTAATNVKVRFAANATPAFVIASGIAKIQQDAHSWGTGGKKIPAITGTKITMPMPSHRTKCEVAGCDTGKPWLTYLPP
jgi:hypothetical protein